MLEWKVAQCAQKHIQKQFLVKSDGFKKSQNSCRSVILAFLSTGTKTLQIAQSDHPPYHRYVACFTLVAIN